MLGTQGPEARGPQEGAGPPPTGQSGSLLKGGAEGEGPGAQGGGRGRPEQLLSALEMKRKGLLGFPFFFFLKRSILALCLCVCDGPAVKYT